MKGSDERDLKIAIIGLGKMGLLYACLLNVLSKVKLVALCDKSGLIRKRALITLNRKQVE
jgi:threonine dehydrogenase-like Zn-dependent dehydrogenase